MCCLNLGSVLNICKILLDFLLHKREWDSTKNNVFVRQVDNCSCTRHYVFTVNEVEECAITRYETSQHLCNQYAMNSYEYGDGINYTLSIQADLARAMTNSQHGFVTIEHLSSWNTLVQNLRRPQCKALTTKVVCPSSYCQGRICILGGRL